MSDHWQIIVGGKVQPGVVIATSEDEAVDLWRRGDKSRANRRDVKAVPKDSEVETVDEAVKTGTRSRKPPIKPTGKPSRRTGLRNKSDEAALESLIKVANIHGHMSEEDYEVEDLRAMLRACWKKLDRAQKDEVYEEFKPLIREWIGDEDED